MPFVKGQSGNPSGRKKRHPEEISLIAACKKRSGAALEVIEQLMAKSTQDRVRLAAAIAILDRAFGVPKAMDSTIDDETPRPIKITIEVRDQGIPEP